MTETFTSDKNPHDIGNPNCIGCFPSLPPLCRCGGRIHIYKTVNDDGGISLNYKCDRCGRTEWPDD